MDLKKAAEFTVVCGGALLAGFLILRYLLPIAAPFLLALGVALLTRRTVLRVSARLGGRERLAAVLVVGFFLLVLGTACYFLGVLLLTQLRNLLELLAQDANDPAGKLAQLLGFLRELAAKLPLLGGLLSGAAGEAGALSLLTQPLADKAALALARIAARLPSMLFFLVVTLIASFFVAADYPACTGAISRILPARIRAYLPRLRARGAGYLRRIAKAYALLFLLTFAELFFGLLLLRERYALLLAFVIAVLDILPILGVGVVLVPWGIYRLLTGNVLGGVCLLLLYAFVTVVRQIAEPHLIGKSFGIPPLLSLAALYVGLRLFGFWGVLVALPVAVLLRSFFLQARREASKE